MSTDWQAGLGKFALAIALGGVTVPCWESMVLAQQIIPDDTLGAESSVVAPDTIKGIDSGLAEGEALRVRISGGAVRGSNLFHSFREFNIGEGKGGYFENPAAIENIFSRVTGSNPSEILGTLGVLGNANLFFLNPNGIIFGQNASLDVRGSFLGTTADSIVFPDGKQFSATNPEAAPLLTVNVQQPIGLRFEGQEGLITNAADLAVASRQTLSLSGSDVATTGNLTAPGGRVEVLGTNSVALLENATIDVSASTGGGTVLIGGEFQGRGTVPNAKRTYVGDKVTINADALTNGNGGKVIVWADEVTGFYGSISARGGIESGHGGLVEVSGKEHLIFRGQVNTSAVNGLPGTLLLDPTNIIIADGSGDEAGDGNNTFAGNNSGRVGSILSAPLSEINDTAPTTIYESELEGLSGDTNIILQATNDIRLQDLSDDGLELAAGAGVIAFSADADRDGVGDFVMEDHVADTIFTNGRDIAISGANLTIGSIDTSLLLVGDAGELIETALFVSDSPGEALESISGNISNVEDVDLFQIYLTGEGNFSASTVNQETTLDTQLFLFDVDGLGVYANDDQAGCNCFQATLPTGDDLTPTEPGVYYLGISTFGDNAVSSGGEIFPSSSEAGFEAIRAPTGDGGLLPLSGWIGGSEQGSYIINLTGVEAAEATVVESIQPRGDSGSITLNATGDININGLVDTSGNLGDGGAVNITARSLFLTNGAQILSGINGEGNAGDVVITATESVILSGESSQGFGSRIRSRVESGAQGTAGDITIDTSSLSLADGAQLSASTFGAGNGGAIAITATNAITLSGAGSGVFNQVGSGAQGNAGNILITTSSLEVTNGAVISASTFGEGHAGSVIIHADTISAEGGGIFSLVVGVGNSGGINITTANLSLTQGAQVNASTFGEGDGGGVTINASDTISAEGKGQNGFNSGIVSNVGESGEGNAGDIILTTANLSLTQGAQVSASIFGEGNAGEITINASDKISVEGEDREGFNSGIFSTVTQFGKGKAGGINITTTNLSLTQGGLITASTFGVGDAGGIKLTTANLSLTQGGTIGVSTFGVGDAGEITINASDTISAEGKDDGLDTGLLSQVEESGIFSRVGETGEGNAGGIILTTTNLSLTNEAKISVDSLGRGEAGNLTLRAKTLEVSIGAQIAVNSEGSGRGGNLDLQADSLTLDTGTITAETASNQGGNINLTLSDLLTLRNHSQITATAGTAQAGGDGGNINIDAPFIIAFPQEDSDITANAFEGDGGKITINANGIFGIEPRDEETPLSDITASSEFGQQGEVEINTSEIEPTRGLSNLPQETVEAEVAQSCQTTGGQSTLEFFAIGRGGLPPSPDDLFSSEIVIAEWIPLDLAEEKLQEQILEGSFTGDEIKNMTLLTTFPCRK